MAKFGDTGELLKCSFCGKSQKQVKKLIADGISGFKFHPTTQGFFPNDKLAYPLYEVIAEHKLPAIFIVENNHWGEFTRQEAQGAISQLSLRAAAYGMPGVTVDGQDVTAVYAAAHEAVERARRGEGPTLIECKTYRWHGHSEHDKACYRTDEELAMWKSRDPIPIFATYLRGLGVLNDEQVAATDTQMVFISQSG